MSEMTNMARRAALVMMASAVPAVALAKAPSGARRITRADYDRYMAAFNARDMAGFTSFYDPDILFELGATTIHGRDGVLDWYTKAWPRLMEHCEVRWFVGGEKRIAVELETQFTALADWPDFSAGPMRKGDVTRRIGYIHYDIGPRGFIKVGTALHKVLEAPASWAKTK